MRSPRRRRLPRFEPTLWLAQGIIAVFRVYARGIEVFGSGKKREKAQLFREKMAGIESISRSAQEQIKQGNIEQGLERLEKLTEQYGDYKESQSIQESRLELRSMREESETLKQIRDFAGDDAETEIAGYQQYVEDYPDSNLALTYLGFALKKAGRLEESLAIHRQALHARKDSEKSSGVVTRIAVGEVLKEMGRLEEAAAEYRIILEDDEASEVSRIFHAPAHLHLGDVLKLQGKEREARAAWKKAVALDQTGAIRAEVAKRLME